MLRVSRCDLARLDNVEVMPSGGLCMPARLARTGVLEYQDGAGNKWGELVPAETLFAEDSMASARGMPVLDLHPGKLIDPTTYKGLSVGHVGDDVKRDGEFLAASRVYVMDAAEIALVKAEERRDCSAAYTCDLDATPGTFEGQAYRAIQRNRVYNHLGLGPEGWGRAGDSVALRLDSNTAVCWLDVPAARMDSNADRGNHMANKHKDGEATAAATDEPKKDAEAAPAAEPAMVPKKDADEAMAKLEAQHVAKCEALEKALQEALKMVAELKTGEEQEVTEAEVPPEVADSIVSKRLAKLDAAREGARLIAPTVKLDGVLKTRAIHEAAIKDVLPLIKFDGLSDDIVDGMFRVQVEVAKAKGATRKDGADKLSGVLAPTKDQAEEAARQDAAAIQHKSPVQMQQDAMSEWGREPIGLGRKGS